MKESGHLCWHIEKASSAAEQLINLEGKSFEVHRDSILLEKESFFTTSALVKAQDQCIFQQLWR